jgi:hypothetical protein
MLVSELQGMINKLTGLDAAPRAVTAHYNVMFPVVCNL